MRFQSQPSIKGFLTTYGNPATGILVKPADKHGRGKAATCYPCTRCGGAGGSSKWHHTGWTCFNCGGSGRGGDKRINENGLVMTAKYQDKGRVYFTYLHTSSGKTQTSWIGSRAWRGLAKAE